MGANAAVGWAVTIVGAMCLALVFARLAALLRLAGGPYAYANAAFGATAVAISAGVLWMTWGLGARADLWGLALLAAGLPVDLWVRRAAASAP